MRSFGLAMLLTAALAAGAGTARAADAEGKTVFQETCTGCHNAGQRPLDAVRLTRAKWKDEVERMEGLGAEIPKGKKLDALLDYLAETHGPGSGAGAPSEKQ